ncbi:hypothetical protein Tco_0836487 [Tanacetum coccineum]
MANLKYSNKHNMVAFLKKPNESVGFTKVVDFLKGTSLRSKLQLADATGIHNLSDAEIYVGLATLGYVTEGDFVPLLPAMLAGAAMDQGDRSAQPAEPHHTPVDPLPSTSLPPIPSPPSVTSLEKELKETKQTLGNDVLKLDIDDDPLVSLFRESMKEKSTDFVTPTKASGEAQEEEISPTILEAAKTLSKVASQSVSKAKSTDKGKRYRRRARVENNTGIKDVNTGSKGRQARWVEEDIQATHKTKEQIRQEEAGLEEAIRLQAQMDEEVAKQIHLDKMVAKRVQEEQELSEQQLKRKAEVQEAAQFYTEEDWDTIRAKLEANTEVVKSLQGESISNDDFAKRMVEMINEKKKFYAEQKAKAKRSKPMTQAQQREFEDWNLKGDDEGNSKIDIEDASITKGKDEVVKEEEAEVPVKKTGKRRKQKARKGINIAKTAQDEFNNEREAFVKDKVKDASSESEIGVDAIPTATKPPTIVNWKIISQSSQKAAYQIIRRDGSDKIYMSFGAILKDFSRDDLIELYRLQAGIKSSDEFSSSSGADFFGKLWDYEEFRGRIV